MGEAPGSPTAILPALLTLAGVARFLSISRRQIHRLLAAGRLPPSDVNLGAGPKGRRWSRERIEAWVRAGCPPADAWAAYDSRRRHVPFTSTVRLDEFPSL